MAETLETMREIRARIPGLPYDHERKKAGRCHAPALKLWKEQGKKIIGFQCVYIPEEIIHAAGMLPIRLTGGFREMQLELANAYLYHNCCSFIRSCMELTLNGHYDFLDGYVSGATCDPTRRFNDVVLYYELFPFVHIISVPRKYHEEAHRFYRQEVEKLIEALESHFKVRITEEALRNSLQVYERTRELFKELYELRKRDNPPITGAEVMDIYNAMFMMPREEFNRILARLIEEARTTERRVDGRVRLMVNGSPLNNAEFIRTIEEQGGIVVVEELCTATRYWWDRVEVNPDDDLLGAICRRYLNNEPCARMMPSEKRWERVLERAKEFKVQGVITEIIRYCVPYAHDQPLLRQKLEEEGIPVLELDVEYGMTGTGQIRTRAQAFLEMLERRG